MQPYELLLILSDNVKDGVPAALTELKQLFAKHGAKVEQESVWGRIKLAYPIKRQVHGTYVLWRLSVEPGKVNPLTAELEVAENVTRFLLTEQPKNQQPITLPVFDDRKLGDKNGNKGPAKAGAVDKSKAAAGGPPGASEEPKKSLDEILDEKI
ncbi:MAG: 30S ribosomal protein S6 [Candidatus Andersenbacteria bacterium]